MVSIELNVTDLRRLRFVGSAFEAESWTVVRPARSMLGFSTLRIPAGSRPERGGQGEEAEVTAVDIVCLLDSPPFPTLVPMLDRWLRTLANAPPRKDIWKPDRRKGNSSFRKFHCGEDSRSSFKSEHTRTSFWEAEITRPMHSTDASECNVNGDEGTMRRCSSPRCIGPENMFCSIFLDGDKCTLKNRGRGEVYMTRCGPALNVEQWPTLPVGRWINNRDGGSEKVCLLQSSLEAERK